MNEVVIKVEDLSKQYRLGLVGTGTFKEDTKRFWARLRGKEDPYATLGEENERTQISISNYVWSLKDINFEVNQGDVLGIIGKNGAGKSTLLKILSKVTTPTTGSVKAKGRIASLLEVGTGFHPELTGRENIYLNGAILGMRKHEITRKFDEIIAFAGVERYIDTPVKRYSSGMYVRLAFAVAAHLESEILIVDEVLAVGDADFQKKCLGKMGDISKSEGRTILFVSHNMASMTTLCNRALLLKNGRISLDSSVSSCISGYFGNDNQPNFISDFKITYKDYFELKSISIYNTFTSGMDQLSDDKEIVLETNFNIQNTDASKFHITYHLINENGDPLFSFSHKDIQLKENENKLLFFFPPLFFQSGSYYLHFFLVENKTKPVLIEKDIFSFQVIDGVRDLGVFLGREPGFIRPMIKSKLQ
jgi:lipopolysaccharide transport system ATP-binding protein